MINIFILLHVVKVSSKFNSEFAFYLRRRHSSFSLFPFSRKRKTLNVSILIKAKPKNRRDGVMFVIKILLLFFELACPSLG